MNSHFLENISYDTYFELLTITQLFQVFYQKFSTKSLVVTEELQVTQELQGLGI